METKYNYDKLQEIGFELEFKKKQSVKAISKEVIKFANRNDVTTVSNWVGVVFGVVGLVLMVVL